MRQAMLLLALPLLAAPVAAQDFEGMIAMKMTSKEMTEPVAMKMYVAGSRQAMVMNMPAAAGPMAGKEMRMVINPATGKLTMLMPAPPGMPGKGMKMVMDFGSAAAAAEGAPDGSLRALGSSQQVAGMSCDDYAVTTSEGTFKMCITTKLGRYGFPDMSGGARPELPGWVRAFGDKPAFPLKVWTDDGSMTMEVTEIKRGPIDPALLEESPEGFMLMPGMGG